MHDIQWKDACRVAGENIRLYAGLRHSTASQMINEMGYSLEDVRIAGDWKSLEGVRHYAKTEIARKRQLLEGKVIPLSQNYPDKKEKDAK